MRASFMLATLGSAWKWIHKGQIYKAVPIMQMRSANVCFSQHRTPYVCYLFLKAKLLVDCSRRDARDVVGPK